MSAEVFNRLTITMAKPLRWTDKGGPLTVYPVAYFRRDTLGILGGDLKGVDAENRGR